MYRLSIQRNTAQVAAMAAVLLALAGALACAQEVTGSNEYRVPEGKTVEGNVVTAGRNVHVAGKVNGSVIATGGEVRLYSGSEVTGDVVVSGGKLQRDDGAKVGGSIMVLPAGEAAAPVAPEPPKPPKAPEPPEPPQPPAPPTVRSGDVVRYGGPVNVAADEVVDGDVAAFGGPVDIEGEVRGDVAGFGGPVTVSGKVTGDVVATGGPLNLKDGAVVGGDAVAIGGPLHRGANTTIGGSSSSIGGPLSHLPWALLGTLPGASTPVHSRVDSFLSPVAKGLAWVFTTITLLLLAGLVTLAAPRATNTIAQKIEDEPLRVAFFGAVGWLLILPVLFVLVILILTWVLIPFFFLAIALLLLIGCVGVCLYGGKRLAYLLNWRVTSLVAFTLIGLGALRVAGLVSALPLGEVLVGLLVVALLVMGLGGALMTRFGTDPTGTWLGRRFNHTHPAPAATPTPGDLPEPKAPEAEHDLDDKTLGALKDLPPDDGGQGGTGEA